MTEPVRGWAAFLRGINVGGKHKLPMPELREVLAGNPFFAEGADEEAFHVPFLVGEPDPAAAAALDFERSPGDAYALRGREIYLHLRHGAARTRLTNAYFDRVLRTTSTGRSWRTIRAVADMGED